MPPLSFVSIEGQSRTVPEMPHPQTPEWDRWLYNGVSDALAAAKAEPWSQTIWVGPGGNDSNDGNTLATRYATVTAAHTRVHADGVPTRINVLAGYYFTTADLLWTVRVWIEGVSFERNTTPWFSRFVDFSPSWTDNGDGTFSAPLPLSASPGAFRRRLHWQRPMRPATAAAGVIANRWTCHWSGNTITINPGTIDPSSQIWQYVAENNGTSLFRLRAPGSIISGIHTEGWGAVTDSAGGQGAGFAIDGAGYEPSFAVNCGSYYNGKHTLQHHVPTGTVQGGVGIFLGCVGGFMSFATTSNAGESSFNSFNPNGRNQAVFIGCRAIAGTIQPNESPETAVGKGALYGCHGGAGTPQCDFFAALDCSAVGGEFSHGTLWSGDSSTEQDRATLAGYRIVEKRTTIGSPEIDAMSRGFESLDGETVSVDAVAYVQARDTNNQNLPIAHLPRALVFGRHVVVDTRNVADRTFTRAFRVASQNGLVKEFPWKDVLVDFFCRGSQSFEMAGANPPLHLNWENVTYRIHNDPNTAPTAGNNGRRVGIQSLAAGSSLVNVRLLGFESALNTVGGDNDFASPTSYLPGFDIATNEDWTNPADDADFSTPTFAPRAVAIDRARHTDAFGNWINR